MVQPSSPIQRLVTDLGPAMREHDRRRATVQARRRKLALGLGLGTALGSGVAVAAATGVLTIQSGSDYDIETRPSGAAGALCLQLVRPGEQPLYGCGREPSAAEPFGLLVVGEQRDGSRPVFGVVSPAVARVRLGDDTAVTRRVAGVPGRYFSLTAEDLSKVRAFGEDADGRVIARLGGTAPANASAPRNREEAQAAGNLSGFAGSYDPPSKTTVDGRPQDGTPTQMQDLVCTQDASDTLDCDSR